MDKQPEFSNFLGLSMLFQLQMALKALDMLGLQRAAIQVDTAIHCLRDELPPEAHQLLETWESEQWQTFDEMAKKWAKDG